MFTPKCTHAGCHWTGTPKQTKVLAEQAVRMHTGRVHSHTIRTPKHRHAVPAVAEPPVPAPVKSARRPYTRRHHQHPAAPAAAAAAAVAATNGVEVRINFCNKCGASIEAQAEGHVLAGLMRSNPKLRAKVEKLLTKYV